MTPILTILGILLFAIAGYIIVDRSGMPADIGWIVKAVIAIIALVLLLRAVGVPVGI